jgi:hypothetical protein
MNRKFCQKIVFCVIKSNLTQNNPFLLECAKHDIFPIIMTEKLNNFRIMWAKPQFLKKTFLGFHKNRILNTVFLLILKRDRDRRVLMRPPIFHR